MEFEKSRDLHKQFSRRQMLQLLAFSGGGALTAGINPVLAQAGVTPALIECIERLKRQGISPDAALDQCNNLPDSQKATTVLPPHQRTNTLVLNIPGSDPVELVAIPSGSFDMGSNEASSEIPIHRVNITGFHMGKYPITWGQYLAVIGYHQSSYNFDNIIGYRGDPNIPVGEVSRDMAIQGNRIMSIRRKLLRIFSLGKPYWE